MGSANDYPVVVKSYELALWYIKKIATFPKSHRYTLGESIQTELIALLMNLTEAIYSKDKIGFLKQANLKREHFLFTASCTLCAKPFKHFTIFRSE